MLKGKAKTDYQREYMRKRRKAMGRLRLNKPPLETVRPNLSVRPELPAFPVVLDLPIQPIRRFTGELTKERQVSRKGFND